jgi:hypothetical protein
MPRQMLDLLTSCGDSLGCGQGKTIWRHVPLCLMWRLWQGKNTRQFEDVETSVLELRRNVLKTLYIYGYRLIIA